MDTARRSLASSVALPRQYSGMFHVTRAPTLAGHWILAVVQPARAAESQSVGARMSSAYQYQLAGPVRSGSKTVLERMPCLAGHTPVMSVVWLGYVTVGITPWTPSAYAPSVTKRRSVGILRPCLSAPVT